MLKRLLFFICLLTAGVVIGSEQILVNQPEEFFLAGKESKEFSIPARKAGTRISVEFNHRIDYPKAGGWCPCWQLEVNGKIVSALRNDGSSRLLNKALQMSHKHHGNFSVVNKNNMWYSLYLPEYHTADNFFKPATKEGSRVVLDISDLLDAEKENKIRLVCVRIPLSVYRKNNITTHRPALAVKNFRIVSSADASGTENASGDKILLDFGKEFFIERRDFKELRFPAAPAGRQIVVEFRHRTDYPRPAGWCPCWQIEVNGKMLSSMATRTRSRLLNKPVKMYNKNHGWYKVDNGADMWYSLYLPDFHAADNLFKPATTEATRVVLDISDAVFADRENVLRLRFGRVPPSYYAKYNITTHRPALAVKGLKVYARKNASELPPAAEQKKTYVKMKPLAATVGKLSGNSGTLQVSFNGITVPVRSRFTVPGGKWVEMNGDQLQTPYYSVKRKVVLKGHRIDVFDTFTSKAKELTGLQMRYETACGKFDPIWVAGDSSPSSITYQGGRNPSVFGGLSGKNLGIGLIAVDDVLRVQNVARCQDGFFGIGSDTFALSPGESRTVEWSVYPVASADYFDFVNLVRRDWQVNFPIHGVMTFGMNTMANATKESALTAQRNAALTMRSTGAHFWNQLGGKYKKYIGTVNGIGYNSPLVRVTVNGKVTEVDPEPIQKFDALCFARCKELTPDIKRFFYFHNQISMQADDEKYADCRVIAPNGKKVHYGSPVAKVFLPTHQNQLGRDVMATLDWIIAKFDIDGIYLDESTYCSYTVHYGDNVWDGCSVELDKNFNVKRKFSFVPLVKLQFTLNFFDRVLNHHKKLFIANFGPETRSELKYKIVRFEETSSSRWIALSHLYTPIQLGDILTYKNTPEDMAKDQRNALLRGALYYHYNGTTGCPSLTSRMYPFTPVELHSGYLIGEERILTVYSGEFGWYGKNHLAQVYVFDHLGREVKDYPAGVVNSKAGVVTRLELKKDHAASLVKIPVTVELPDGVILSSVKYENNTFTCQAEGRGKVTFKVNGKVRQVTVDGKSKIELK